MKNSMITEFVEIKILETTTNEQLMEKAEGFIGFLKKKDGFIDGELIEGIEGEKWYFIFHYETMEKVKAIAVELPVSKEFDEFKQVLVPGSINVSFYNQLKKW